MAEYLNLRTGVTMHLHPTSALFGLGTAPEYIIYHELILTAKQYASIVTAVDPIWLAEVGSVFFSVRHQHFSDKQKQLVNKDFSRQSELELEMARDAAKAEEEKLERSRAEKSAAATPRVATSKSIPCSKKGQSDRSACSRIVPFTVGAPTPRRHRRAGI